MDNLRLTSTLQRLAGHLVIETRRQRRELENLYDALSATSAGDDSFGNDFSIREADLFSADVIPAAHREKIDDLSTRLSDAEHTPQQRVFVRETPIRDPLLPASVPDWAVGARPDRSIGPFEHRDGRRVWFDFFPFITPSALHVQGIASPVLLFPTEVRGRATGRRAQTYELGPGSFWMLSTVLTPSAPPQTYTCVTIDGGRIELSAPPQVQNGILTVSTATTVTVELNVSVSQPVSADADTSYGPDARNARVDLPRRFRFHFSGVGQAIDEVGAAAWDLYGQPLEFTWNADESPTYDPVLRRVLVPFGASDPRLEVRSCESDFHVIAGAADIQRSGWALPVARIDVSNPPPADGAGALFVQTDDGITDRWANLTGAPFRLVRPVFLASTGLILISDATGGGSHYRQRYELWKDEANLFGSSVEVEFAAPAKYSYASSAAGAEIFSSFVNADCRLDRPVQVNGEPPPVRSVHSLLTIAVSDSGRTISLYDDNLLQDTSANLQDTIALAMTNALFTVSHVNGCLLFGALDTDHEKVQTASLFLTFGLRNYVPTLPDPYAANLRSLGRQFGQAGRDFAAWLVARVQWVPAADHDQVGVSFHFAPLSDPFAGVSSAGGGAPETFAARTVSAPDAELRTTAARFLAEQRLPDYGQQWEDATGQMSRHLFALLDVSTNADLMGVSFEVLGGRQTAFATHVAVGAATASAFPIQVEGMDVVTTGRNVRAFTVPQISWEPVINLSPPEIPGDPPFGFNYYPDDGGPTQILNDGVDTVALAPLPVTTHLIRGLEDDPEGFRGVALTTLPFGMRALALLGRSFDRALDERHASTVRMNAEKFGEDIESGLQLQINAGESPISGQSNMFAGSTIQVNNVLDASGQADGDSTLGDTVTRIFNGEFAPEPPNLIRGRGVPLERIDISGYGASICSDWLNPHAALAETSQAKFDVFVGRCAHEIIQVKSIIYPWAIKVVRTITLLRAGSGYILRSDSGWKAESNGEFDFRYFVQTSAGKIERTSPFRIHPGIVRGLFNVTNIVETTEIAAATGTIDSAEMVGDNGLIDTNPEGKLDYRLQPVYFDADVDIETPVSGFVTKRINGVDRTVVASRRILGYVQVAPRGLPITNDALRGLVVAQQGSIGGPIDCVADLAASGQRIRLNRIDFNNSFDPNGTADMFAVAARGNVLLPKDGAWSLVKHQRSTGDVAPVPADLSVPVIRIGQLIASGAGQVLDTPAAQALVRIAEPTELLRAPTGDTVNYGFLQSTDTQKALFLTPAFEPGQGVLVSKTPPLFADAFRIVNSKAVFPNIGDAQAAFGDAISLLSSGTEFAQSLIQDGGAQVWRLMDVAADAGAEAGYKLLKQGLDEFQLPDQEFELIDLSDGNFRIYIEYAHKNSAGTTTLKNGKLDFDIDSAAANLADTWKSRMADVSIVVDLAGIKRLMTIRGQWDSRKGAAASYPKPELVFADELKPVVDILQILQQLQGGDYAAAVAAGLQLAMSNKAGSWEYKFQASKEIPVLRFPVPDAVYHSPTTPLKLEAGLRLSAYFNAALPVPTDNGNLPVPSAGAALAFYGRLSVMCVSLAAATVYAVGQVNLEIAADTKLGPSLRMKFGFGAQIVVGLPVVGSVSVLYAVGVEIFAAGNALDVTGFLLFEGHAELLGGLVGVTIRIEARGTVSRRAIGGGGERTDLACQVTFGLDISIALVIDISFETSWSEQRQIA